MKVAELTGVWLDYWAGKAAGFEVKVIANTSHPFCVGAPGGFFSPSTNWEQCGPMIEEFKIELLAAGEGWCVPVWLSGEVLDSHSWSRTPQEAICRAVVRAKFGDEVPEVAQ